MFLRGLINLRAVGFWPSVFGLVVFIAVTSNCVSDNKEKNIVLLFQDVTLSQWKSGNKTAVLRRIILDVVNEFCPRNPSRCSLNFWNESRQFILSHVVVVEPLKQEDKDIQVKVFVALPDGKDIREDDYVAIAGSVLKEILEAYKQNLSSAVGAEVKSINTESDSNDNVTDNTMNYIMIPITFALLVVLCCVAFCLHSASKRKKKAIEKKRRKQLRLNRLQPSADDFERGEQSVSTADAVQKPVAAHETRRKEKTKKHQDETGDHTRKTKKTTTNGKHKRLKEEAMLQPAMLGGQLEIGERERVPTPIPGHSSINKHTRKKKQKKAHRERREHDEGYSEGSDTKQTGELNKEELLIRSLPRPRQLAPLPERTDIQL